MIRLAMITAILSGLVTGAQLQAAETPPAGGEPRIFSLPDNKRFALPNGMAGTLVEFGAVPKTTILITVQTGNIDDGDNTWLADLTGELLSEGTTQRSAAEVARTAASMGGDIDIAVGMDQTSIRADVLSEHMPQMIALLAEILTSPALPAAELPRIRADFLRNLSVARTQPGALANEAFSRAMYGEHAYGRVYPTAAQLQSYTIEQIRGFFADNFGAARSRIYIGGRFDAGAAEKAVRNAFGSWHAGTAPTVNPPVPAAKLQVLLTDRPGAPQSTVYLGLPVLTPTHPDYLPLQLMNVLLGGAFSSRITANIREDKGYTYSPRSSLSMQYGAGDWREIADVTTEHTGAAIEQIVAEIRRLQNEPPTADEMDATKNYRNGTFVLSSASRAGLLGQLAFIDLHGLDDSYLENYLRNVNAVPAAELSRLARQYLPVDRMTLVVVGDLSVVRAQLKALPTFGPVVPD